MQSIKNIFGSKSFILIFAVGIVYLVFIPQMSYFNDDWYLMYAAGARGAGIFKDIFIVDRPMRAWIMTPAYLLFGNNPALYNLSALVFRILSALILYWCLSTLWKDQKKVAWLSALLYAIYPGFLSQFNGIDYQSQMVSLALMMLSLALIIIAYRNKKSGPLIFLFVLTTLVTTLYLGLVEYFIGMEVLKIAVLVMLIFRGEKAGLVRLKKSLRWGLYSGLTAVPFLVWRFFFFESERGATDINFKLGGFLSAPFDFLSRWSVTLLKDINETIFGAYFQPLQRLSSIMTIQQWLISALMLVIVLFAAWFILKDSEAAEEAKTGADWRLEAIWLGSVMVIFGLLPVILVGRGVDFKNFSRYTLAPSIGVVLLWQAGLAYLPVSPRNIFLSILIGISVLTHCANGFIKESNTRATDNFWWQVSWRIPQFDKGVTLITHYSVTAEEDYFTWGPANLIYYPASVNEKYAQPAIYAALLSEDTVNNVLSKEGQVYSKRRNIRTYPNYRDILILTQPTAKSCVQVIDLRQIELSSFEDERVKELAPYSEADQIMLDDSFHTPPAVVFGKEPEHDWCFYYQKASYARQVGDWEQVSSLGEMALHQGYFAHDQVEWMPFVQAYAYSGNLSRLKQIASKMSADPNAARQACRILESMQLDETAQAEINQLFCK